VRASGADVPLATGSPTADACSRVEHRFAEAGTYAIEWDLVPEAWALVEIERLAP
jgi:hypothetical protein